MLYHFYITLIWKTFTSKRIVSVFSKINKANLFSSFCWISEIEVLPDISISEIQQKEENKFALLILENLVDKIEFKEKSVLLVKNKG